MDKKKILIISFSRLNSDPRVYRQIANLSQDYNVTAAGLTNPDLKEVEFVQISERSKSPAKDMKRALLLKLKKYDEYYRETFEFQALLDRAKSEKYNLIIANDSDSLQLAFMISDGSNVLHDAHEYAPKQQEEDLIWRFFMMRYRDYLCRHYLRRCKAMITVSDGIAQEYERVYGVKPQVITNATEFVDIEPSPIESGHIRLIHHGSAHRARKIEKMIEMMDHLDERFTLDLMLVPSDKKYYEFLKKKSEGMTNVRFRDPVPMKTIVKESNRYDVGIYIFEPTNFNQKYALPNKIFEYVQSRLAIAIGPSPEMQKVIEKYDCGVIADDYTPESMAKKLNQLDETKISYYKSKSSMAAREISSETNISKLLNIVIEAIKK